MRKSNWIMKPLVGLKINKYLKPPPSGYSWLIIPKNHIREHQLNGAHTYVRGTSPNLTQQPLTFDGIFLAHQISTPKFTASVLGRHQRHLWLYICLWLGLAAWRQIFWSPARWGGNQKTLRILMNWRKKWITPLFRHGYLHLHGLFFLWEFEIFIPK